MAKQIKRDNSEAVDEKSVQSTHANSSSITRPSSSHEKIIMRGCSTSSSQGTRITFTQNPLVDGPPNFIAADMVVKTLQKTKNGKAADPSDIVDETLKASGKVVIRIITCLSNLIVGQTAFG